MKPPIYKNYKFKLTFEKIKNNVKIIVRNNRECYRGFWYIADVQGRDWFFDSN